MLGGRRGRQAAQLPVAVPDLVPQPDELGRVPERAGQGAGNIDDLPGVDELVARLDREYRDALRNMDSLANRWPR